MDLSFKPTYKLSKKDDKYSGSESQCPSYTDRIFCNSSLSLKSKFLEYCSHDKILGSDHRPVYALIETEILSNYIVAQPEWDLMKPLFMHIRNIKLKIMSAHLLDMDNEIRLPFTAILKFYSPAIEDYGQTAKILIEKLDAPIIISEMHPLKFAINDIRYIRMQKLIAVMILDKPGINVNESLGQAVILMTGAKIGENIIESGILQNSSRILGEISIDYSLKI